VRPPRKADRDRFAELFCDDICFGKDGINGHLATGAYMAIQPKN